MLHNSDSRRWRECIRFNWRPEARRVHRGHTCERRMCLTISPSFRGVVVGEVKWAGYRPMLLQTSAFDWPITAQELIPFPNDATRAAELRRSTSSLLRLMRVRTLCRYEEIANCDFSSSLYHDVPQARICRPRYGFCVSSSEREASLSERHDEAFITPQAEQVHHLCSMKAPQLLQFHPIVSGCFGSGISLRRTPFDSTLTCDDCSLALSRALILEMTD